MFKQIKIPMREFYCELKHRPPDDSTGEQEQLIETLILEVPRLRDSAMERQWAIAQVWNKLHDPEFKEKGINQVFIFTAQFGELIIRLEVNKFDDEPARKLSAPDATVFSSWQEKVQKQFKKLYGVSVEQWRKNTILSQK
jgi:hypothetical protein